MDHYLDFANSWLMWLLVIPGILVPLVQAVLFIKKGMKTGAELGIQKEQWKTAIKSSAINAIGPSAVACAGCLALIVTFGSPLACLHLSYVGAAQFDLANASAAVATSGAALSADTMNMSIFATGAWTMTLLCLGWTIVSVLFVHKMDTLQKIVAKGNKARIGVFAMAACTGAYGYLATSQCLESRSVPTALVACLAALLIHVVLAGVGRAKKIKWMTTWGFTISMFAGLVIGVLLIPVA